MMKFMYHSTGVQGIEKMDQSQGDGNTKSYSSATKSCPIFCDPMDCSTPCSSVLHYLLEVVQIHVH